MNGKYVLCCVVLCCVVCHNSDHLPRCTMSSVLEGMARILKVDQADLRLETEGII